MNPASALANLATLDRVDGLRLLEKDWNGYGADPINPRLIEAAKVVLGLLPIEVPTPQVVPMTRGRFQLEWHRGHRSLELEFEKLAEIHYVKYDSELGVEEEEVIAADDVAKIMALLDWFSAESADVSRADRTFGR